MENALSHQVEYLTREVELRDLRIKEQETKMTRLKEALDTLNADAPAPAVQAALQELADVKAGRHSLEAIAKESARSSAR